MNGDTLPLEIKGLRFTYPNGTEVLKGVDLCLRPGEKVALIGANGAGKSTLLLHTNGILIGKGSVSVYGRDAMTKKSSVLREIRGMVGMVFQNPDDQLFSPTVWQDVEFGPKYMGLQQEEIEERVEEALKAMGIGKLRNHMPHELSGGEKRRVAIATVLSMRPSLIVADEPTADLDPNGRRQLAKVFSELHHTVLAATHDLDLVGAVFPECALMKEGGIVARGNSKSILADTELLRECGL